RPSEADLLRNFVQDLSGGAAAVGDAIPDDCDRARGVALGRAWLQQHSPGTLDWNKAPIERFYSAFVANSHALRRYTPARVEAPVLLLEAAVRQRDRFTNLVPLSEEPTWLRALPRLERHTIDADHFDIVRDKVLERELPRLANFFGPPSIGARAAS